MSSSTTSATYYGRTKDSTLIKNGFASAKNLKVGKTYYFTSNDQMDYNLDVGDNQFVEVKVIKHIKAKDCFADVPFTRVQFRLWDYHIDTDTDTHYKSIDTTSHDNHFLVNTMAPMYMTIYKGEDGDDAEWDEIDAYYGDEDFEPTLGTIFNSLDKKFFLDNDTDGLETWDVCIGAEFFANWVCPTNALNGHSRCCGEAECECGEDGYDSDCSVATQQLEE